MVKVEYEGPNTYNIEYTLSILSSLLLLHLRFSQFSPIPWWLSGNESAHQCRRHGFHPWIGKITVENKMATQSSILAWEIPWAEEPGRATVHRATKSQTRLSD